MSSKISDLTSKHLSPVLDPVLDVSGLVGDNSRPASKTVFPHSRNFSHPAAATTLARTPRLAPSSRRLSQIGKYRTAKSEEIVLCHPIKTSTSPVSGKRQHPVLSSLATSPIRQPRRTRGISPQKQAAADRKQTLEIWTKKNLEKSETTKSSESPTNKENLFSPKTKEAQQNLMRKLLDVKDGCFGGDVWREIQLAFEPHIKATKTLTKQEFVKILEDIDFFGSDGFIDSVANIFGQSSSEDLDHHKILEVLGSIYKMAHPQPEPGDTSVTVVLLQDKASEASGISSKLSKAVSRLHLVHKKSRLIRLMRVQYARKTDIREQFWRLALPVHVTFMFYTAGMPVLSNARKLRTAFPNMKICLCGNDVHLRELMRQTGLTPSQWKLSSAIADDFLFEPFRDIDVQLASLLKFEEKNLSTGSNNLEWAKKHLRCIRDSDDCPQVRVSSHSIADVQQDFINRMRDGKVMTTRAANVVPYVYQGDTNMYTAENLHKRKRLFFNKDIAKAIRAFWHVLDLTKDNSGHICLIDFLVMNIKIQKALMPCLRINNAVPSAVKDWKNDCKGDSMSETEFFESFFEMADLWCATVDYYEYVFFLVSLLNSITKAHDSAGGCRRWRCDQDISHDNFKRAVEQLKAVSDEDKGKVAMSTSNPGPKWSQGALVDAEDATGVWRWATITACNDDGTFNVYIYDDNKGGGQEWGDVRPVNLRKRSKKAAKKGIAKRPPKDIPRWDRDKGAAFRRAVAAHTKAMMAKKAKGAKLLAMAEAARKNGVHSSKEGGEDAENNANQPPSGKAVRRKNRKVRGSGYGQRSMRSKKRGQVDKEQSSSNGDGSPNPQGARQLRNRVLEKVKRTKHANFKRSASDDVLARKSKNGIGLRRKKVECTVPGPIMLSNEDDAKSNAGAKAGQKRKFLKSKTKKRPKTAHKRLQRLASAPEVMDQATRSERRRARKIELEKERMKITVYRGVSKAVASPKRPTLAFATLASFSVDKTKTKPRPTTTPTMTTR